MKPNIRELQNNLQELAENLAALNEKGELDL